MFIAKDGSFIVHEPLFSAHTEDGFATMSPDIFECDSLIAPVIALLNEKGYPTEFSCQGHISTHSVINHYCYGKEKAVVINERNIWTPYIKFNHNRTSITCFTYIGLPDGWKAEFVLDLDKGEFADEFTISDKSPKGCDFIFRLDEDKYFNKLATLGDSYTDFDFYIDMIEEIKKLYQWAKKLSQRPRRYKILCTKVEEI